MNVALINPKQKTGYPQPPMGLALLAAVLEQNGHHVAIFDMNMRDKDFTVIYDASDVDVIGITATTPTVTRAWEIARNAKEDFPKAKIIMGGQHVSLLPEETLKSAPVDVVVKGEGEKTILEAISENNRASGVLVGSPVTQPEIDALPYLAYHLLPWRAYRYMAPHGKYPPTIPMITSRGCPYHCAFCSKPVFGNNYRAQSAWRVVSEVRDVARAYGICEIAFYDDVFTLDKKRTHEICDRLLSEGVKVHWTCETRVNLVDRDLLKHMKQAGCMAIAYGIESGSAAMRSKLSKGITLDQIEDAVEWTHEAGIETIGYFMVGNPGETPAQVKETVQFAKDLRLDYAQFSQTMAYPGTALYDSLIDKPKSWDSMTYTGGGNAATRSFYFRPAYLWQRISGIHSMADLAMNLRGVGVLVKGKV
jgi:anaerobic magnesium-protoporphyrin IX monomethyl ester cyclase